MVQYFQGNAEQTNQVTTELLEGHRPFVSIRMAGILELQACSSRVLYHKNDL